MSFFWAFFKCKTSILHFSKINYFRMKSRSLLPSLPKRAFHTIQNAVGVWRIDNAHLFVASIKQIDAPISSAIFFALEMQRNTHYFATCTLSSNFCRLATAHNANASNKVELITHGSDGVIGEIQRSVIQWLVYLGIGEGTSWIPYKLDFFILPFDFWHFFSKFLFILFH